MVAAMRLLAVNPAGDQAVTDESAAAGIPARLDWTRVRWARLEAAR